MTYTTVQSPSDLLAVLQLQKKNLPAFISTEEARQEGFVTVQHDLDLLTRMNTPYPHIIARDDGRIIAYALVMERKWKKEIPMLVPMFQQIDSTVYEGQSLVDASYFIMGQICIEKTYRGRGVFTGLYAEMQKRMAPYFDYIITEVSVQNPRSIRAHEKTGFKEIKRYIAPDKHEWIILLKQI